MVNIKITIDKNDLGFSPTKVKSLLEKFSRADLIKGDTDKTSIFTVNLDFDKEDANDLSTALIWMFLKANVNLPCKKIVISKLNSKKYFDERHFFDSLTGKKSSIFGSTSVPINFESFSPIRPSREDNQNDQIIKIFDVITKNILNPKNRFHSELKTQMTECVQNSFDHSASDKTKLAGSVCSLKENGFLDFCVIDMGQGIKKSFLDNSQLKGEYFSMEDKDVIAKATNKKVSCNPKDKRNPKYVYNNGGIGLYYLREFIRLHPDSTMVILSGRGYYHLNYRQDVPKLAVINSPWPGTLVYFRTRLDQDKSEEYNKLADRFIDEFGNS